MFDFRDADSIRQPGAVEAIHCTEGLSNLTLNTSGCLVTWPLLLTDYILNSRPRIPAGLLSLANHVISHCVSLLQD